MSEGKVVVAAAMIFLFLPSCERNLNDSTYWETEREEIELTQQLKLAEYRLGMTTSGDANGVAELERVESNLRELNQRTAALLRDRSVLGEEVRELEVRNRETERLAVRKLRMKSVGRKFDTLVVNNGRTFENVSITGVDDGGVAIRHEHGTARLRYSDLSAEQCASFGLEERSALAAEDRERRESIAYERRIDEELDAMREKEEQIAAVARRSEETKVSRALVAANTTTKETSPLAKPASQVGRGSSYRYSDGYSTYRSYRPRYRYVYYYPVVRNPFNDPTARRTGMYNVNPYYVP
jgi:hypothetical protein